VKEEAKDSIILTKSKSESFAFYGEHLLFLDPMIILDLRTLKCMTMKLSLEKLI
jgi:hypothetical protein